MGVKITGIGSYLPKQVVTREDVIARFEEKRRYGNIPSDYFDIPAKVHHAGSDESATFMGTEAALKAVTAAGLTPEDIDLVLCFSTIPDQIYPKDGQFIVHQGKFKNATAFDLDLACGSFQTLLKTGSAFINQGLNKRILLVVAANWVHRAIDKSMDYSPLGDAAAAVVLEHSERDSFIGIGEKRAEQFFDFVRMSCSGITGKHETIQFTFTDDFKAFLKGGATDVARELLDRHSFKPKDVTWFICHEVGLKAMRGWCRSVLGSDEKLLSSYDLNGNCMSSNMPLVLDHYVNVDQRIKRGDLILFYSLAAGFHASATLWRY